MSHVESRNRSARRWRLRLAGAAVIAVGLAAHAQAAPGSGNTEDADLAGRIDQVAAEALAQLPIAGMSIAVAAGEEVVVAAGYGSADLPNRVPAEADTVYQIGSISKQFTAAAILGLVEQGRLSLDDPVSDYVAVPPAQRPPTLGQLLSHTAGFTDIQLGAVLQRTSEGVGLTVQDAVDLATAPGYAYPPGSRHEYSNGGYLLAYQVVEAVTGQRYRDALTSDVLAAGGLEHTAMCPETQPSEWAQGYRPLDGRWLRAARLGRPPGLVAAGPINADIVNSVCSTAPDLVRWARALRTGEILTAQHYQLMVAPARLTDGTTVPYGMGQQRRRFGDHRAVSHGGILPGFVGLLADFPDDDITIALLVNTLIDERDAEQLATRIMGAVFDEPPQQGWVPDTHEDDGNPKEQP